MGDDSYPIPGQRGRIEIKIRNSRFIATIDHAPDALAARRVIDAVRREFQGASHNCWAYTCGSPQAPGASGAGDDGEPRGTAGRPMLAVLSGSGVRDVVAVVTRWFGGIRLGTGGLVRAYSDSVRQALEAVPLVWKMPFQNLTVDLDYADIDRFRHLLAAAGGRITAEAYDDAVHYTLAVPAGKVEQLMEAAAGTTAGRAVIRRAE